MAGPGLYLSPANQACSGGSGGFPPGSRRRAPPSSSLAPARPLRGQWACPPAGAAAAGVTSTTPLRIPGRSPSFQDTIRKQAALKAASFLRRRHRHRPAGSQARSSTASTLGNTRQITTTMTTTASTRSSRSPSAMTAELRASGCTKGARGTMARHQVHRSRWIAGSPVGGAQQRRLSPFSSSQEEKP